MVSLAKLLPQEAIIHLTSHDKDSAIRELVNCFSKTAGIEDSEALITAIMEREALLPTGIGYGLAIPHAKVPYVRDFGLALGISREGIDYGSPVDDMPAQILFLIVGPEGRQTDYLRLLARVNQFLKREQVKILGAPGIGEIYNLTKEY